MYNYLLQKDDKDLIKRIKEYANTLESGCGYEKTQILSDLCQELMHFYWHSCAILTNEKLYNDIIAVADMLKEQKRNG